jgi:hypothetical protein
MYTHNWFHTALFYLEMDQLDDVEYVIDNKMWTKDNTLPLQTSLPNILTSDVTVDEDDLIEYSEPSVEHVPICFPLHDKCYVEDQNCVLNMIWKLEIKRAGAGSKNKSIQWQQILQTVMLVKDKNTISKNELNSYVDNLYDKNEYNIHIHAEYGSLYDSTLNDRYESIVSYLHWPPQHMLSLFGLLCLHAYCRTNQYERAYQWMKCVQSKIDTLHGERKYIFETFFWKYCMGIYIFSLGVIFDNEKNVIPNNLPSLLIRAELAYPYFNSIMSLTGDAKKQSVSMLSASGEQREILGKYKLFYH